MREFSYGEKRLVERARSLARGAIVSGLIVLWVVILAPASADSPAEGTTPKDKESPQMGPMCEPNWQVVSSPNVGSSDNMLNAVDKALTGGDIWAVGYYYSEGNVHTLIQNRQSNQWNMVPSANVNGANNVLRGVSALSPTSAWAVGDFNFGFEAHRTLMMHWNGTHWGGLQGPNVGRGSNYLTAVKMITGNDVWAVGYYANEYGLHSMPLIEHWDGRSWTIVPSENIDFDFGDDVYMSAIDATSPADVWAVGYSTHDYGNGPTYETLILHYDGVKWNGDTIQGAGSESKLLGVTAITDRDVWAVGSYINAQYKGQTLIVYWTGDSWSVVPSPNANTDNNYLYSVDSASANNIWAVGRYFDTGTSSYRTLTEHWDGSTWSIVPSPNATDYGDYLYGVVAASTDDIWAVGWSHWEWYGQKQTLTERYSSFCPTPTATPSMTPAIPTITPVNTPNPLTPTATPTNTCPAWYPSTDVPKYIPDDVLQGANSHLTINGATGNIADIDLVNLNITHSWVGDMVITLRHVDTGHVVTLVDRMGLPPYVFGCASGIFSNVGLDDSAATLIENVCMTPVSGTFKPNNLLSIFNGESPNGAWTLNVSDQEYGNDGDITSWGLRIMTDTCGSTPTATNTPTNTPTRTFTPTRTNTPTNTPTKTPTPSRPRARVP